MITLVYCAQQIMFLQTCKKFNYTLKSARSSILYYSKVANTNIVQSPIPNIDIPDLFIDEYIWQNVDKWRNKTAVVCAETGRSYLYSELYQKSGAVSNFLRGKVHGLKERDVIAIVLPNIPEYPIIMLGIIQAGFKVTTVNPNYTAGELSHQLLKSDAKFVFTMNKLWPQVKQAIEKIPTATPVAIIKHQQDESIPTGAINFNEIIKENHTIKFQVSRTVADVAIIPYSSGTTGLPKGVELTHRNIVSNFFQVNAPAFKLLRDTDGSFQEVVPLVLPVFHLYGMAIVLFRALASGSKLIMIPKFMPESFINVLEVHNPTVAYLVPPLVLFLLNNNHVRPEHITQLTAIVSASAPIGAADIARLHEKSNHKTVFRQYYGLTETGPVTHSQTPYIKKGNKLGGAGLAVPNTEVLIVPYDGNDRIGLGPNMPGEILIRGPQVMKGYYKNAKATQAALDKDGWFHTGDIGYNDGDGHLFVTDRLKEIIKVKGFQVAPAELEEILRSHPNIEDAAVIGIPHTQYGEVPKAFIVQKKKFGNKYC